MIDQKDMKSTALYSRFRNGVRLLAMAGLLALAGSCATDRVTGKSTYNLYSVDDDIAMGKEGMGENVKAFREKGVPVLKSGRKVEYVSEIVKRVAAVSDMPELPYEVTVFDTNVVNAAAFPGGQIMVFTGLDNPDTGLVRDQDELAFVIAHEIAHVNCRHSTEELSKTMTAAALVEAGAQVAEHNDKKDVATITRGAFVVGSAFVIPMYSRADEREADAVGLNYMARAGYDPRAAVRLWSRAADKEKQKGQGNLGGVFSIFDTHPGSSERAQYLSQHLPQAMEEYHRTWGKYPDGYQPTALPPTSPHP
jgi:predicted Zn-dependent protease